MNDRTDLINKVRKNGYDKDINSLVVSNIYAKVELQSKLTSIGVCIVGSYNKDKLCFEKCICNNYTSLILMELEDKGLICVDGVCTRIGSENVKENVRTLINALNIDFNEDIISKSKVDKFIKTIKK